MCDAGGEVDLSCRARWSPLCGEPRYMKHVALCEVAFVWKTTKMVGHIKWSKSHLWKHKRAIMWTARVSLWSWRTNGMIQFDVSLSEQACSCSALYQVWWFKMISVYYFFGVVYKSQLSLTFLTIPTLVSFRLPTTWPHLYELAPFMYVCAAVIAGGYWRADRSYRWSCCV